MFQYVKKDFMSKMCDGICERPHIHSKMFVVFSNKSARGSKSKRVLIKVLNIGLWIAYSRVPRDKNQEKTEKYQ